MIKNKVYKLKQDSEIASGISLPAGQELEIVQDVVYVNGNMVPPEYQALFLKWIVNNPNFFTDDTRQW
jgi:hypothetical protein